ncbi:N-acetylglucosamine repressor [Escherichia coli]|uniref:N-acetylglucosamine repressor n=1 Tax=Escherichia coli TaxID=562 RepID=A0A376ZS47_ECOLX|nr:N-acetylglucosamine repressor [Escherichia coli]STK71706.1 N-acetylglucosamine repressor [Escherichia coli]
MTPGGQAQIGNVDLVKQLNSAAVYRLIDQYGPISRIQIAEQSQLAPASVNQNYASAYRTRADQRS